MNGIRGIDSKFLYFILENFLFKINCLQPKSFFKSLVKKLFPDPGIPDNSIAQLFLSFI